MLSDFIEVLMRVYAIFIVFLITGVAVRLLNTLFILFFDHQALLMRWTSLIGVPFHEMSHMIVGLVFGYRIESFKLIERGDFQYNGYVNFEYSPTNRYQKFGAPFVAMAPIILGILLINGMLFLMYGDAFVEVWSSEDLRFTPDLMNSLGIHFNSALASLLKLLEFDLKTLGITLMLSSLVLHINLSKADLIFGRRGVLTWLIVLGALALLATLIHPLFTEVIDSLFGIALFMNVVAFGFISIIFFILFIIGFLIIGINKSFIYIIGGLS